MAETEVGLPKSLRIAQTLEREIRSGRMSRGDQLASENELVRRFSVSRNTVRKSLEQLARLGLITTRTGVGSFVTYEGSSIDNALGWTRALSKTEDDVETQILNIKRGPCAAASTFVNHGAMEFLHVDRLRKVPRRRAAISLERSRCPWRSEFAHVLQDGLINGSLGETLASAGLVVDHGEEWAEVLPALSKSDSKVMGRKAGEPMLRLRRVTRNSDGEIIEFVESILDPSRFGLHLEF